MLTMFYIFIVSLCVAVIVMCGEMVGRGHPEWWFVIGLATAVIGITSYFIHVTYVTNYRAKHGQL